MRALCTIFVNSSLKIRIKNIVTEAGPRGNLKNQAYLALNMGFSSLVAKLLD